MFGFTRYQWTVLLAAWLGWGFDVFDGLLFNFVAPNCVPALLGLPIGSPEAKQATLFWTGMLTSLLLLGWAAGGVIFGKICDRIGRTALYRGANGSVPRDFRKLRCCRPLVP
jgi:MFS family permease